jgi:hypothetical protein
MQSLLPCSPVISLYACGCLGGNYPFDRHSMSASVETNAVNANKVQQQHLQALNDINSSYLGGKHRVLAGDGEASRTKDKGSKSGKGSAFHAFHTATGAMYLEKLHPSLKLFNPDDKSTKSKRSKGSRVGGGAGDSTVGDDVFNMTATNEAEPDEFSSTFNDNGMAAYNAQVDNSLAVSVPPAQAFATQINVRMPKAAFGTVRQPWNQSHYCYSKFDTEHNHSKNKHLFGDFRKKIDEENIRSVLQKKLERGERLPLQSQDLDFLQASAVDCSHASTILANSQALMLESPTRPTAPAATSGVGLANSIFDPNSAARKSLSKNRKDVWALNVERLHDSAVAGHSHIEDMFLNDNAISSVDLEASQSQTDLLVGSKDPLYIIHREESLIASLAGGSTGSGLLKAASLPLLRGSELRVLSSFSAVNPEMWVTARVVYLLLSCYYLVMVNPDQGAALRDHRTDTTKGKKKARPAKTNETSKPEAHDAEPKGRKAAANKSALVDKSDVSKTKTHEAARKPPNVALPEEQPLSPRNYAASLSDEEYLRTLARKTDMMDLWKKLAEQLSLCVSDNFGSSSISGTATDINAYISKVVSDFSWPNLQELLKQPAQLALACHVIEYDDMSKLASDDGTDGNGTEPNQRGITRHDSTGNLLTSRSLEDPSDAISNQFYARFPQALLPILRTAVHRKVFTPAFVEPTSPICARLCHWARRVVAGIYQVKARESTLNLALSVSAPSLSFGLPARDEVGTAGLGDSNTVVSSRQQLPPISLSISSTLARQQPQSKAAVNMFNLVNYSAAGRAATADGKASTLSVVSVGFDMYASYHAAGTSLAGNNEASGVAGTLPLTEQFVLDDVLVIGMILARPYDRLDVLVPSPPESLIQQHLKDMQIHANKPAHAAGGPNSTLSLAQQYPQLSHEQLQDLQLRRTQDDTNWQQFENLTHFCKAHIEVEANSPSHRILPAAIAFDVDVAVDELIEDGVDSAQFQAPHAQPSNRNLSAASDPGDDNARGLGVTVGRFSTPNKHHSVTVSLTRLQATGGRVGTGGAGIVADAPSIVGSQPHAGTLQHQPSQNSMTNFPSVVRRISRADIITKLNTFNKLTEHRNHLQTYGDRQVFSAIDVVKYAQRKDVQANIIVVGLPSGKRAQQNGNGSDDKVTKMIVNAELVTSILAERGQDVSLVIACAGISDSMMLRVY